MKNLILFILLVVLITPILSQKGKEGVVTISTPRIVNEFAAVLSDVSVNDNQLTLSQTTLNSNNRFANNLAAGDLILIIQAQGASVDALAEQWTGNGEYGLPYDAGWGAITNYNNCGNYEYAEIANINSSSLVTLRCGVQHNYTASGKVQVVRIPRYKALTLSDTLNTQQWNGSTGGICAIEVDGNLTITATGVINANAKGFRGGLSALSANIQGAQEYATPDPEHGGMKGEGIAGYATDYTPMGGQYGKGAAANAGGGSTSHNAGGGGGGNAGDILNWNDGVGNPNSLYNSAWGLETPSIANVTSSGGGRGGYTYSAKNADANTVPTNDTAWGGDKRRNNGGLGGRPLDYTLNRLFFGGGGGAGEINDSENEGGNGGNAGGMILLKVYGSIMGTGKITANGKDGENIFTNNAPTFNFAGNDGAGGAGAGGTIKIENTVGATIGNLTISANGGKGGNQILKRGSLFFASINEAEGPGGGGGGGFVSIPTHSATITVNGGINGTTNSNALSEFPPNGATSGGNGLIKVSNNILNLTALNDTICFGTSTTLTAMLTPTLPSGSSIIWYDENYNMLAAGTNFTTGTITNDTTFYVGICPENTSVKVQVIVGSSFTVDSTNLTVVNEHCNLSDGSITGIVINGGALPLTYQWNGVSSTTLDTTLLAAGSYQLVVTDNDGCSSVGGTITILNESGPAIDSTLVSLQNESCNATNGSISGITVSGGTSPLAYSWNNSLTTLDQTNLAAGTYSLVVTDFYGCKDSSGLYTISPVSGLVIDTTSLIITPETCQLSNGAITSITTSGSAIPFTYSWSNGSTTLAINGLSTGNYQLIASDANGCLDSITLFVGGIGFPTAGFITDDTVYLTNELVTVTDASSSDVVSWSYQDGNNTISTSQNTTFNYSIPGEYIICQMVQNAAGCEANYCQNITVVNGALPLIIPNILTANGDGVNDAFTIQNLPEGTRLSIFDRWGVLVYEANPYLNNWTGKTSKGAQLSDGTYYYIITTDKETKTGHLSILK